MADLRAMAEAAGANDVSTYIQSGNVVFSATAADAKGIAARLSAQLKSDAGLDVPVVDRPAKALTDAVAANPYPDEEDDRMVHLGFLSKKPAASKAKVLDPDRSPPDTFVVDGDTVFVHYPNGAARSKLTTAFFDKGLDCREHLPQPEDGQEAGRAARRRLRCRAAVGGVTASSLPAPRAWRDPLAQARQRPAPRDRPAAR